MKNTINKLAQHASINAVFTSLKMLTASTLLASAPLSVYGQECLSDGLETTPDDNFEAVTTSTLLDTTTDLVWRRCSEGQTWDGSTCSGEAVKYTWQQALQLAQQASNEDLLGWRLPNVKELATLTERDCVRPAINSSLFPETPPDDFWTSTPSADDPDRAWVVAFFNASHSIKEKDRFIYVRLVRTYTDE
ncbi:DUF1566 domain-containing protein [Alteromonas macleodii]|uniref:Lcl C-terminal domain-containing protein n=1 Tax=Alteromonas macleodii TaxID=28108 RepID=A0A6T9Y266_ALTMA|nr:DUF1566 domain-containing protein [Alteromonas macleodii]CAB9492910.1 conserved exported protein of unknown function [Alteromonas macleodii]